MRPPYLFRGLFTFYPSLFTVFRASSLCLYRLRACLVAGPPVPLVVLVSPLSAEVRVQLAAAEAPAAVVELPGAAAAARAAVEEQPAGADERVRAASWPAAHEVGDAPHAVVPAQLYEVQAAGVALAAAPNAAAPVQLFAVPAAAVEPVAA